MENYQLIDIRLVDRPNPPVRIDHDDEKFQALCESIRQNGILVPLMVRPRGERFEVIDGDRRLAAAWHTRQSQVPAMVRDTDDRETYILRMLANLDRDDVDPVSEAVSIANAITNLGFTAEEIAQRFHSSLDWVAQRLAIAEMPEYMQIAIKEKRLPLGVALELVEIDHEETRRRWTNSAVMEGMTVRGAQDARREYERLKELAQGVENPNAPFIPPEEPPTILYPCKRCGGVAAIGELILVRIHRDERACAPSGASVNSP